MVVPRTPAAGRGPAASITPVETRDGAEARACDSPARRLPAAARMRPSHLSKGKDRWRYAAGQYSSFDARCWPRMASPTTPACSAGQGRWCSASHAPRALVRSAQSACDFYGRCALCSSKLLPQAPRCRGARHTSRARRPLSAPALLAEPQSSTKLFWDQRRRPTIMIGHAPAVRRPLGLGGDRQVCHEGDARQRLASKPKRADALSQEHGRRRGLRRRIALRPGESQRGRSPAPLLETQACQCPAGTGR